MANRPSPDPLPTVDHVASPGSRSTVGGATEPHLAAPPADAPNIPGYRITAEIATGGMGRVYAGHDLKLGREVALKTLLPGADAERFVVEARITARLPHPGIPPVYELGTLDGGSPYLAMKLVRGRTLAELLGERPSPLHELPRFVQVFEQIAQAVGFAHAQGIVHRDLKPLNVMVGAFGEVQVMDWGLAKDTAGPERERLGALPEGDNVTHTVAGTVLGTPAYMAPEQARGEPVDARADVFALGATLAAILTGRAAFAGTTVRETIGRAARAELDQVRDRLTGSGADGELIGLALRCLSARAEERPADGHVVAAEVAAYRAGVEARLKRAETEKAEALVREAEQRKRRRTVQAAAGVVALVLTAGLGVSLWQMARAIAAEASATAESRAKDVALQAETKARADEAQARKRAFAALRSMTADVVERKFAQGAVLTEDDRAFLRGIIAQFDAFAAIQGDDAETRALRAEGRVRVGVVRSRLGESKEAEKDYDEAIGLLRQLVADFPARPRFRDDLALVVTNRSVLLSGLGRLKEAEKDHEEALGLRKQLAAEVPDRFEYHLDLSHGHNNRGVLLRSKGRPKEAEKEFDQALAIQKHLAANFPARPELSQDLGLSHYNRGAVRSDMGRLKEAEKDYDASLGIRRQLAADFPDRPRYRHDLSKSYNNRAILLSDTGRREQAGKDYDEALSLLEALAAEYPGMRAFRQDLGSTYSHRGLLRSAMGRLKEAERDLDTALGIQRKLAADPPAEPDLRNEVAGTCVNLAINQRSQGDLGAAKRLLLEGRAHHLAALKINPGHPIYRQFYRNHLFALAVVHAGLAENDDAVRAAETRRDLGWNSAADAYDAACMLSQCSLVAAGLDTLGEKQRREVVQSHSDAAMKMLSDAVGMGYNDVPRLKNDNALAPLRGRGDFKKLLADQETRGK